MTSAKVKYRARAAKKMPGGPAEMQRLLERAEQSGCDRCRGVIPELAAYFICRDPGGRFSVRCPACRTAQGARPVLGGTCVGGIGLGEPWSRDDRAWFAAHPKRRWRLREPLSGEIAAAIAYLSSEIDMAFFAEVSRGNLRLAIATLQIAVGKRMHHVVGVPTADPLDSFTEAGIVRLVPRLAGSMSLTEDEAERMQTAYVQTKILKTSAELRAAGFGPPAQYATGPAAS